VTESWSNEKGVAVGITVGSEFDVPFIGGGSIEINTEYHETWTSGKEMTEEQTISTTDTINIPACTYVEVQLMAQRGKATIPYTANIHYKDGSVETIKGVWAGVAYSNEELKINILQQNICASLVLFTDENSEPQFLSLEGLLAKPSTFTFYNGLACIACLILAAAIGYRIGIRKRRTITTICTQEALLA